MPLVVGKRYGEASCVTVRYVLGKPVKTRRYKPILRVFWVGAVVRYVPQTHREDCFGPTPRCPDYGRGVSPPEWGPDGEKAGYLFRNKADKLSSEGITVGFQCPRQIVHLPCSGGSPDA